jgi:SAM-dependent methyltransferase
VTNATFVDEVPNAQFDLIVSLIVFQHIAVARGMQLLRILLERLRPGGVAMLHFTVSRAGGRVRRALRSIRAQVPFIHRIAARLEGNHLALPYMQMNEYDLAAIRSELDRAGCEAPKLEPTNHGGVEGVIVVTRR